jgi:hypothetical protein
LWEMGRLRRAIRCAACERRTEWVGAVRFETLASQSIPSWISVVGWLREMDGLRRAGAGRVA